MAYYRLILLGTLIVYDVQFRPQVIGVLAPSFSVLSLGINTRKVECPPEVGIGQFAWVTMPPIEMVAFVFPSERLAD